MSLISEGQDKILKARTQLTFKHPFFSILAFSLLFRNAGEDGHPSIKTMATDGRHIWWDEHFVDKYTIAKICGVIAHEILHVVFFHCLRRGIRDPLIWNIACDYAVNLIVIEAGFELPDDKLYDLKYKNWLVDAIYDDLIQDMPPCTEGFTMPGQGDDGDDQDGQSGQSGQQGQAKDKNGKGKTPLWGITMEPQNDDGTPMSDAQKTELVEEIKIKAIQAATAAKSVGKLPVALEGLITAIGKPTVNWADYIQTWVSGKVPDDYTWKRPNRKMLGLYNLFAPSVQVNGAGIGVLSIDTSGSVSDAELVKYVTEITGLIEICNPEKLYIIQHDTRVNRIDEWEAGDDFSKLKVTHRGGTCIKPTFEAVKKFDEQIDWMICFTDMGINDYPSLKDAPDFPILWAATGPNNAPFGTYLPLKNAIEAAS